MSGRTRLMLLALVGMLLASPALTHGLHMLDDPMHRNLILDRLAGRGGADPWFQLFSLIDGDRAHGAAERVALHRPWWADDGLSIRFLRPVAAASHYLDYLLWPEQFWLMHLHSVLFYGAACLSVGVLLRRLSQDPRAALLGAFLYAIDDAHAEPTAWLANRNALIATSLAACALYLYVRARQHANQHANQHARQHTRRAFAVLSPCALLAALLCAESTIGITAFFGAYALFLDRGSWQQRLLALGPAAGVTLAWLVTHRALGYGARGSGFYLDPATDPGAFVALMPERMWALLQGQLAGLDPLIPWLSAGGVNLPNAASVAVLMPALALWLIRRGDRDRELAFWVTGAVLAMVPLLGVPPHPRLLVISGIGWAMALAKLALVAAERLRSGSGPRRAVAGVVLGVLVTLHVVLSPIAFVVRAATFGDENVDRSLMAPGLDATPGLEQAHLVVLNAPTQLHGALIPVERARHGLPVPRNISVLGATPHRVEITRTGSHSFELSTPFGYLEDVYARFWRSPSNPLPLERVIRMQDHVAVVRWSIVDGRPQRVLFRFDQPLEAPAYRFVVWHEGAYEPFTFAPTGIHTSIPASYDSRGVKTFP